MDRDNRNDRRQLVAAGSTNHEQQQQQANKRQRLAVARSREQQSTSISRTSGSSASATSFSNNGSPASMPQQQQQQQQQQLLDVLGSLPPELAAALVQQILAQQERQRQQQQQANAANLVALLATAINSRTPQQQLPQPANFALPQPANFVLPQHLLPRVGGLTAFGRPTPSMSSTSLSNNGTSTAGLDLNSIALLAGIVQQQQATGNQTNSAALLHAPPRQQQLSDADLLAAVLNHVPNSAASVPLSQQQEHRPQDQGPPPPAATVSTSARSSSTSESDSDSQPQQRQLFVASLASQDQKPQAVHQDTSSNAAAAAIRSSSKSKSATSTDHRTFMPLGIDEDNNWLSDYQCYVRKEFMEVFQAKQQQVEVRSNGKRVNLHQVGIRCAFCSDAHRSNKAPRSSAFPSSIRQIYQSFAMMLRDHFDKCQMIPTEKLNKYHQLKARGSQGASDSKNYWEYAAAKLGLVDTGDGIAMSDESRAEAARIPSFRSDPSAAAAAAMMDPPKRVVEPGDRVLITPYLYELLSQLQLIHLLSSERVAKRKHLPVGLEGIGCRHCARAGRLGFSRCFPLRRHLLPVSVQGMHNHLQRCALCPRDVREKLEEMRMSHQGDPAKEHAFYDRLWGRLNRKEDIN